VAKCQAIKLAGRVICDEAETFWEQDEWLMRVSDENGLVLFQLQILGTQSSASRGCSVSA
jgi:hypothetical protein